MVSSSCTMSNFLCIEVYDESCLQSVRFVLVYRPPNSRSEDDDDLIDRLMELCISRNHTILLGDFNLDIDWCLPSANNPASAKFLEFFTCLGITQHVTKPTRNNSILDIVLSSAPIIENLQVLPPFAASDHNCISFDVQLGPHEPAKIPLPNFLKADYLSLSNYLNSIDWWSAFQGYSSADDLYKRFCDLIRFGLYNFVPVEISVLRKVNYPKHIRNLIAQKERIFLSASADPLSSQHYKRICSELDRHLKTFLEYRVRKAAANSNSRTLFALIRNKMKLKSSLPVLQDEDGNQYLTAADKAEALASFFSSVFTPPLGSVSSVFPCINDNSSSSQDSFSPNCLCEAILNPHEVLKVLKSLKPSTSLTSDGIPQIVYRKCAHSLYKPLTMVFNVSLMFSEIPTIWKTSIVTAIPKTTNSTLISSFRPISITPTPMKVMEKLIRDRVVTLFVKNSSIPVEQHGFTSGASTVTQLSDCLFDWSLAISNGNSVDAVYFDLSKAFDKVNHVKLLRKLYDLGIRGSLLKWFQSYLSDRHMCVKVNNSFSRLYPCPSGVPQGGVLSPLLFLAYTHDIPRYVNSHPLVKVQIYADDIKIYGIYNNHNHSEIYQALSLSIIKMMKWAADWDIPVNLSKTCVFHIGSREFNIYKFNDMAFNNREEIRDLGVTLKSDLNFEAYIDLIVRKAYAAMFTICRNTECCSSQILIKLYKAYVVPILEYASQIWSPTTKKLQRRIEKVQQTFTKILVYKCSPNPEHPQVIPNYKRRLSLFKLNTLFYRRIFTDLVFAFKILKGETKLRPSKYWIFRPCRGRTSLLSLHNTRLNTNSNSKMYNNFFFRSARWIQMLPSYVIESPNSSVFKARLKKINLISVLQIRDLDVL